MSTGNVDRDAKQTSVSIQIGATAEQIFALLADPKQHPLFDGSGMLQGEISGPSRLTLGDKFSMSMKFGPLPYRISSTVVEFEENRLIAWQHFGKHRWRYALDPNGETTVVTETFDWSTSILSPAIEAAGYPDRHLANIERTLGRLRDIAENGSSNLAS